MKHLTSWSVFEKFDDIPGEGDLSGRLSSMGIEGLELFTLIDPVDMDYYGVPEVISVHLPYAIDWHCTWEGRDIGLDEDLKYYTYGKDREEMVANLRRMIDYAAVLHPAYGVFHAGNTDMRQVLARKHRDDGGRVLHDLTEMLNTVMSVYPKGEPPFRLALENLWWEGLKLRSPSEWRILEDGLEFDNWGFTLDTGHLMNTLDTAFDEDSAIDGVLDIVTGFPKDMIDRIGTVHLQLSTTAEYRRSFPAQDYDPDLDVHELFNRAFTHAGKIDDHRPFTSPRVKEIVEVIDPDYLTHELYGKFSHDRFGDVRSQRAIFG